MDIQKIEEQLLILLDKYKLACECEDLNVESELDTLLNQWRTEADHEGK